MHIVIDTYALTKEGFVAFTAIAKFSPDFRINPDATGGTVLVNGDIGIQYGLNESEQLTLSNSTSQSLSISTDDFSESIDQFEIIKISPLDDSGSQSIELQVELDFFSSLFETRIQCVGDDLTFPSSGYLNDSGAGFACNGSYGTVTLKGPSEIYISLPEEPDPILTYRYYSGDILDGEFGSPAIFRTRRFASIVPNKTIFAEANHIVFDRQRSRALLAISSSSASAASTLSSYTLSEGFSVEVELNYDPGLMRLSADGSLLYVMKSSNAIEIFSIPDFQVVGLITTPTAINTFAVSPVDPDFLVVSRALEFNRALVALYQHTVEVHTESNLSVTSADASLAFFPDGSRLLVNGRLLYRVENANTSLSAPQLYQSFGNANKTSKTIGNVFYFGANAYDVDQLHKLGGFTQHGSVEFDELSGLAFVYADHLDVCDIESMICFERINRQDSYGNSVNFYNAKLAIVEGELLVANEGSISIYSISDFEPIRAMTCDPELHETNSVPIYSFNCGIKEVVYDGTRDKLYAIAHGASQAPITASQLLIIDPTTQQVDMISVPLRPTILELSADDSTLYIYDKSTNVINRYSVSNWEQLAPLVMPLEVITSIMERVQDVRSIVPSAVDPNILLLERYYFHPQGHLAGFNGVQRIVRGTQPMPHADIWADESGMFYADHDGQSLQEFIVSNNTLSHTSTILHDASCLISSPLTAGYALSYCGEVIDFSSGSISPAIDFSEYTNWPENQGQAVEIDSGVLYRVFNDVLGYPEFPVATYDINTKQKIHSTVLRLDTNYKDVFLGPVTASGYFSLFDENDRFWVVPDTVFQ